MTLTFKSSIPESFTLTGRDTDGRQRTVTATKNPGDFNWRMNLRHTSGQNWDATYHAPGRGNAGILDAMAELMRSKDSDFKQDKGRGDRPPQKPRDYNLPADGAPAPITAFAWRTR
jgi:hypothetical protein